MSTEQKPFWIKLNNRGAIKETFKDKPACEHYEDTIHVIEYSAFEAMKSERDDLLETAEIQNETAKLLEKEIADLTAERAPWKEQCATLSFLLREAAQKLAKRGGTGFNELIFEAVIDKAIADYERMKKESE